MNDTTKQPETLENFCNSLGLEYKAEFVPFSKSRHAGGDWDCLNWKVTISKGNQSLTTDYSQGVGHIPKYKGFNEKTIDGKEYIKFVIEHGAAPINGAVVAMKGKNIAPPKLCDIMYSLASDSDAIDYTFEEWADTYGYDTDSRKAESTYRQCLDMGLKLRRMLGDQALADLREAAQDY